MRNAEWPTKLHEDARRAVVGAYVVVKEADRRRGPRRQALLYILAALRARRVWRAAPGGRRRVWRWTGASKKSGKFFWPTTVAHSARERGGLLVVRSQGVMAFEMGEKDCQAAMSVVVYWCFNALVGAGWRIASCVCDGGYAGGRRSRDGAKTRRKTRRGIGVGCCRRVPTARCGQILEQKIE